MQSTDRAWYVFQLFSVYHVPSVLKRNALEDSQEKIAIDPQSAVCFSIILCLLCTQCFETKGA